MEYGSDNHFYTLLFKGLAHKGSIIAEARREARGKKTNPLLFAWINYPPVPCSRMVGGVPTMRPESNSDNLQFPIVLLALGVGLRTIGRVYPTLPYPILMGRVG